MALQSDDEWVDEGGSIPVIDDSWADIDIASDYLIEKTEKVVISKGKDKHKKKAEQPADHPLDKFGFVRKLFIMEHLRTIDYTDIARILGIDAGELKASVEKLGIMLPIERACPWAELDVGAYVSPEECARCQVQGRHARFYVGFTGCRECLEQNIALWIEKNEPSRLTFPGEL